MLPALPRLPGIKNLIEKKKSFVITAPPRSGKTTILHSVVFDLNKEGKRLALRCDLETIRGIDDVDGAMNALLENLRLSLRFSGAEALKKAGEDESLAKPASDPAFKGRPLELWLRTLCSRLEKDLVILFDGADCPSGGVLMSFFRQLRSGFAESGRNPFPRSVGLAGVRDVRNRVPETCPGERPDPLLFVDFAKNPLTPKDFTLAEMKALYAQHAEASGQAFTGKAVLRARQWSEGHPGLVNALAGEVVENIFDSDYDLKVTEALIDDAAKNILKRRNPLFDRLSENLPDPGVRRVVGPMLAGGVVSSFPKDEADDVGGSADDGRFAMDLGLVKKNGSFRPANPIYHAALARHLSFSAMTFLPRKREGERTDREKPGMMDILRKFSRLWNKSGHDCLKNFFCPEAAPYLALFAFLHEVLGGTAEVKAEYAGPGRFSDIVAISGGKKLVVATECHRRCPETRENRKRLEKLMERKLADDCWMVVFTGNVKKGFEIQESVKWHHVSGCRIIVEIG
ncbi:MAG: ATP-binding protein [Deltaproteobacteria bacterium]|jgi:hypothetical protein|nr:ATP-binding protein [Deltaproteobacteria bacterium]